MSFWSRAPYWSRDAKMLVRLPFSKTWVLSNSLSVYVYIEGNKCIEAAQRLTESGDKLRQVEATDWTMAENIEDDYHCFTEKLLQCTERAERTQPQLMNSRVSGTTMELLKKRKLWRGIISKMRSASFSADSLRFS